MDRESEKQVRLIEVTTYVDNKPEQLVKSYYVDVDEDGCIITTEDINEAIVFINEDVLNNTIEYLEDLPHEPFNQTFKEVNKVPSDSVKNLPSVENLYVSGVDYNMNNSSWSSIIFRLMCPNCGNKMEIISVNSLKENVVDLDFLDEMLCFECDDCGKQVDVEVNASYSEDD